MLQPILTPQDCAACKLCCSFDRTDLWELPLMTAETADAVRKLAPHCTLAALEQGFLPTPREEEWDAEGLYACPALGEAGCRLPREARPFECLVWPFRVMEQDGVRILCVAQLCAPVQNRDRAVLIEKLRGGLADEMFRYAAQYPESVKPFAEGYTALLKESGECI